MKVKGRLINAGILIGVFIVAVIGFSYFTNRGNDSMTADMGAATYPQVSFSCGGYGVNTLPGYAKEMDIPAMRDTITPVTANKLDMEIKAYENKITSGSYMVYTLDGENKLLDKKIKKPGESITLDLSAENLLAEERVLEVVLNLGKDKSIYFYTRITNGDSAHVADCLNYIGDFHENALGKVEGAGVGTAIEPSEEGDNTTFGHVTIHSDYKHVSWGDLEPKVEGGERWNIVEINNTFTAVQLEYQVRCKGEENEEDIYRVKEYFRVRHIADAQKTYLLDYDRKMEQVFNPTKTVLNEKGILLGITSSDVPYMVNADGTSVSFIQAGELWNYNKSTDEVSLVFSFSDAENTDVRNLTPKNEIKLLEMDGNGNTTFAVYGYMNRGEHEGEVGVAIYYYDMEKNSVGEKVFISSNKSYGSAVNELGRLVYYSVERDMLYVMVDGSLYEINVEKKEKSKLVKDLEENQYVVSDDGHLAAYQSGGKLNEAKEIIIMDLSTGKERKVTCEEGECIRPLGFIRNDFVYGAAKTADTGKTASGETVTPMYKIEIRNSKNKIVKTYENEGAYVLEAEFEDNMITLRRASKNGDSYTQIAEDYITNNKEKEESNIFLESYATELKETQKRLTYEDGISDKEPKVLKPKQVLFENPTTITFDDVSMEDKCYVYGQGELLGIYDRAGTAIQKANEVNGVVVSARQTYIWERGNRDLAYTISGKDDEINIIRSQLSEGKAPVEIVDEISDNKGIDLTGCTTEELLYIINQDIPVIGMIDSGSSVILAGYTESSVIYVDTASGERQSVPYAQMDQMTQGSGNTYIAYESGTGFF